MGKIIPILTNQRLSPYKAGTYDSIQFKLQVYSDNKIKPSHIENVPVQLYLNYSGYWSLADSKNTNRFGSVSFTQLCHDILAIDYCLAKAVINLNGSEITSNTTRINFINVTEDVLASFGLPSEYISFESEYFEF